MTPKPSLFMQQLHLGLTSCVQDQITVSWLSYAHAIPKFVCRVFKERKRHLLLKGGLVCINQTPFSNLLHQMHQHPHQAPTCQKTIWLEFCLDWWHYHISFFQQKCLTSLVIITFFHMKCCCHSLQCPFNLCPSALLEGSENSLSIMQGKTGLCYLAM